MSKRNKQQKSSQKNDHATLKSEILRLFNSNPSAVFNYKSIAKQLDLNDVVSRKSIHLILTSFGREGILNEFVRGKFRLAKNNGNITKGKHKGKTSSYTGVTVEGILDFTSRGSAYLVVEGEEKDIYINPRNTNFALDGDRVTVAVIKQGTTRDEGKVIDVLERGTKFFVGVLHVSENFAFLKPDNAKMDVDIFIPKNTLNGASHGQKALVKMTDWPKDAKSPMGEVVEVLGMPGTNDAEMISILVENGIEYKFPQEVIEQAEKTSLELDSQEIAKRRDFRDVLTFTIDPKDAKDFDDALSIQRLDNGNHEIGIHIADVSHYVQMGTAMDEEALKRSNSVYLVDRVVPMLPEQLSNIACSLRPNEDKYSFSAVFEIDDKGEIKNEWFGKTAIHSNRRYSYEEAQEVIEGKDDEYKNDILYLDKLAKKYREHRMKSGALNIESEEIRFKLNDLGQPEEIIIKVSKDAHKLVEEFMLLANRKVAEFIGKKTKDKDGFPLLYRVHDKPDLGKIETFKMFIDKFGYEIDYKNDSDISKSINKLLNDIRYKNEYAIIQTMAIRSMAKANYETTNLGHYGLAFEYYAHFTSPIRRYADLVVHRILNAVLTKEKQPYLLNTLNEIAKTVSRMERKAVEAERSSTKYFQVQFVKDKIGETFEATVSGITDFGMFAEMKENRCEGLIAMDSMKDDRYYFEVQKYRVVGAKNGKSFTVGDTIFVKIKDVDARKRTIDLELVN